jgi:serine/threonine protein kinase/Tol biopolymer transport system component
MAESDRLIGSSISHYRIVGKLGEGGMGVVYKAEHTLLQRFVALKFLPDELAHDAQMHDRLLREARAASTMNHPNICTIYDVSEEDGRIFIAMEFLDGVTLRQMVQQGPIKLGQLLDIAGQVLDGLEVAHSEGIIHRDIKLANVFVTKSGRAKILDFGLAKKSISNREAALGASAEGRRTPEEQLTSGLAALGTAAYMSPEQALGKQLDARTDLFSFGIVLYEMATGRAPFHGNTTGMLLLSIVQETPEPLRQINPDLPERLQQIINKCLQKDQAQRYQTASEIRNDLQRLQRSSGYREVALTGVADQTPVASTKRDSETGRVSPATEVVESVADTSSAKGRFDRLRWRWPWIGVGTAVLALLSTIAILRLAGNHAESPMPLVEVMPLVALQGKQTSPAFSPDGNQVAFVGYEGQQGAGIYTTLIGGEKPLRLTDNPSDCCPTWSPDSRQIAFVRLGKEIYVISALGGSEHKIFTGHSTGRSECSRVDWSPDGKVLAFSEPSENGLRSRITLLSFTDLTTRALTSPSNQEEYDCEPAFSPDGMSLAFVRGGFLGTLGELFVQSVSGGGPRQLTSDNSGGAPVWTQDGSEILFSSAMQGVRSLWRISASGGTSRPVAGVGEMAFSPSISRKGNQLAYQHVVRSESIWRINLKDERHSLAPPVRVFSGRGFIRRPNFSPDGKKIAFESDRLGYSDIWYCDSDGSNCTQLTSLHGVSGTARWSPDGHYIAFESLSKRYYEIYIVEVPGGQPRLIATFPGADNGAPNWSRDGQWIYFYSAHESGPFQLWKVSVKGGSAVKVTRNGGVYASESADGRFLYYSKFEQPGVWKMPLRGGEETQVLDQPISRLWFNWGLARTGIYFLNSSAKPNGRIEFFDFATRKTSSVFSLEKPSPTFAGLAVSPDGRSLLFGQSEYDDSNIMLVKNFR